MGTPLKIAEHAGNAAVGAFAFAWGDVTDGAALSAASLSGFAQLASQLRGQNSQRATRDAIAAVQAALEAAPEFRYAEPARVAFLLSEAPMPRLRPYDLVQVIKASDDYDVAPKIAETLLRNVPFDRDTPASHAVVKLALEAALKACAANEAFKDELRGILLVEVAQKAQLLDLLPGIDAKTDALMAKLDKRNVEQEQKIELLLEQRGMVKKLAQRFGGRVEDFDTAYRELERAVGVAAALQDAADLPSNTDDQVRAVVAEMAKQNAFGDFDGAAQTVDNALERIEAEKSRLLDAAVDQEILRRNAPGVAQRLWEKLQLEVQDRAKQFVALQYLSNAWYERGRDQGLSFDAEVAIELATISCSISATAEQLAVSKINIGLSLQIIGERESRPDRLENAISVYKSAPAQQIRKTAPSVWATIKNNLGIALTILGKRERDTFRLEAAVSVFQEALQERTKETVPELWADTQNNLGMAFSIIGEREKGTARLERAVSAYRAALDIRIRDLKVEVNLGNTLRALGQRESGTARLEEAVLVHREVVKTISPHQSRINWATAQIALANSLSCLGEREESLERLEEALSAYNAALEVFERDQFPLDWAMIHNNLGNALQVLSRREGGTRRLIEAEAAYLAALEEWTHDRVPLEWAKAQKNLGDVLQLVGQGESGTQRLEEAQVAYNAALKVYTRAQMPLDWAITQIALSGIWVRLFDKSFRTDLEASIAYLESAESCLSAALEIVQESGETRYVEACNKNLELISDRRVTLALAALPQPPYA